MRGANENNWKDDRPIRILFIGNSYTYFNNLPELLTQLAASDKKAKTIEADMHVRGGATLKQLWEEGLALKRIKQGRWDYVVLQEQSLLPISDSATMHKYARLFDAEIKQSRARTIFYLTWSRQNKPETQQALAYAYLTISKELGALVAPVGIAWQNALDSNRRLGLHLPDLSHPTPAGSYLAACVFYAVIFEKTPENLTGRIVGHSTTLEGTIKPDKVELVNLSKTDAQFLQQIGWKAVRDLKSNYVKRASRRPYSGNPAQFCALRDLFLISAPLEVG
jgi:hypothetical protein